MDDIQKGNLLSHVYGCGVSMCFLEGLIALSFHRGILRSSQSLVDVIGVCHIF